MADVWANYMGCHPRATCHIAWCCHRVNSTACHPRPTYHITGCCHLVNSLSWFQSHMPHCRCSHLAKSMSWSCHIAWCNNSIRHIENRFSPNFILFFNAVWALTSGCFRITSDTFVLQATCRKVIAVRYTDKRWSIFPRSLIKYKHERTHSQTRPTARKIRHKHDLSFSRHHHHHHKRTD